MDRGTPSRVRSGAMAKRHTVRPGECLSSIAHHYELQHWQDIYQHPENAGFREKRPNPNVIRAGDVLYIPDPPVNTREHAAQTDRQHQFRVRLPKVVLRLRVLDEAGAALGGKKYELMVQGRSHRGTTDGDGVLEHPVPASATSGALTVWGTDDEEGERLHWNLAVGHLDPITTVSGVQARLNNLGYRCGEADGVIGRKTRGALKGFQHAEGLPVTGRVDEATRGKVLAAHGGG